MNHFPYHDSTSDLAPVAKGFWGSLLNTASLYGEVLLRSRFGERHLTLMGTLLGLAGILFLPVVAVAIFTFLLSSFLLGSMGGLFAAVMTSQLPWARGTVYFHLFMLTFLARSCWHFIEMEYRRRAGEQVLSTYSGRPNVLWHLIPGFGHDEGLVKRFGEPGALLLFALWVRHTDFLLTLYLATSAIAMFVKGHFEAFMVRHRLYDMQDHMLESQALGGHLRGRSNQPGDVKGVALPAALAAYPPHQARALTSTLQNESPVMPSPSSGLPRSAYDGFVAGLSPEFAGMLSPSNPADQPLENWFVEEARQPVVIEWFEKVSEPEQPNPKSKDEKVEPEPTKTFRCTTCNKPYRFRAIDSGKCIDCRRCKELLRIPDFNRSVCATS